MTTTTDTQSDPTSNGTSADGSPPIVDPDVLAAAEQAAAQPPAGDAPATIRDPQPPAHDETEIPGAKDYRGAKIVGGIALAAAALMALIFMAHHLGAKSVKPRVVTKTVPADTTGLVSKDMDDNACAMSLAPKGETYASGWCRGRAPGAYLFADDTVAYCSCGEPRGK